MSRAPSIVARSRFEWPLPCLWRRQLSPENCRELCECIGRIPPYHRRLKAPPEETASKALGAYSSDSPFGAFASISRSLSHAVCKSPKCESCGGVGSQQAIASRTTARRAAFRAFLQAFNSSFVIVVLLGFDASFVQRCEANVTCSNPPHRLNLDGLHISIVRIYPDEDGYSCLLHGAVNNFGAALTTFCRNSNLHRACERH